MADGASGCAPCRAPANMNSAAEASNGDTFRQTVSARAWIRWATGAQIRSGRTSAGAGPSTSFAVPIIRHGRAPGSPPASGHRPDQQTDEGDRRAAEPRSLRARFRECQRSATSTLGRLSWATPPRPAGALPAPASAHLPCRDSTQWRGARSRAAACPVGQISRSGWPGWSVMWVHAALRGNATSAFDFDG